MKLIQIPFSHNCVKVRAVLTHKRIACELENINPTDRSAVRRQSGQGLVPVLIDGDRVVADSTEIALHLERRFPDPPLIPPDAAARAECLVLEDWADQSFMALSRRIAYSNVLRTPGLLGAMFFPRSSGLKRRLQERIARRLVAKRFHIRPERYPRDTAAARHLAGLAVDRIGSGPWLLGPTFTIADIALACMSAPLAADPELATDPGVKQLLSWGEPIIGPEVAALYRGGPPGGPGRSRPDRPAG